MGLFKRKHSGFGSNVDPNPNNFTIKKTKCFVQYWVSLINYPDAQNYEGNKILLTTWDPRLRTTIDPHFSIGSGILARFEPTDEGWDMAKMYAKMLLNSNY